MSLTTIQYEELAERIELILQDPERAFDHIRDERIRRRLAEGGRKLSFLFEPPRETLRRIGYSVCRT